MAGKSDFAQKLLNDLRARKEKMTAAQSSSRQQHTQTSRAAHGNTGQASRGSRQITTLEFAGSRAGNTSRRSNTSSSSRSTNTKESSNQIVLYGNEQSSRQVRDLSMAIAFAFESSKNRSASNPLVNFFNRFGRRSRDSRKMDITTTFDKTQFPTVSNVHITEVSKGVQKLNHILRACSNGFSFDANSIEIGKELLKGAVDLEESLRMLVNLQDASEYANGGGQRKKSQLKLIEEDEEDRDDDAKVVDQWKLGRPRFSFDKPSRDSDAATKMVTHKRSTSYAQDLSLFMQVRQDSHSSSSGSMQEKRRISNVVAKLMGLEELPQNDDIIVKKNEPKGKQGNVSKQNTNLSGSLNRVNQVNGHQNFDDSKRKQNPMSKNIERESRTPVLNTEQTQKAQNGKSLKGADKTHDRIGYKPGVNSIEKRNADKTPPRNQQKPHDQRVLLQEHALKRGEHLMAKNHKGQKPTKSTVTKKALSHDRSTPNRTHQDDAPMTNISQQTAPNKENIKKEHQIHSSSTREPQSDTENEKKNMVPTKEKPIKKVQRSEMIPKKIDVLMSRRNVNANVNHLTKSTKKPTNMLKDLKQQMRKNTRIGIRKEEQSDSKVKDEKAGNISAHNALEKKIIEPVEKQDKLRNEDDRSIVLNTSVADEPHVQNTPTSNDNCDDITVNSEKVSDDHRTVQHPNALKDEQELIQCDQSTGEHEQEITHYHPLQQLTEPEKQLKEIVIKSQTFLSTSEALFKLNIPLSLLHDDEATDNKLVLSCAHEVMKRKARRHGNTLLSRARSVRSLDDLIRQLCRDIEALKSYGGDGSGEQRDVAASLYRMLEKDIYDTDGDVNSMWDLEWSNIMWLMGEKEDVVRDVERYLLNGLLDEVTGDVMVLAVSV